MGARGTLQRLIYIIFIEHHNDKGVQLSVCISLYRIALELVRIALSQERK